MHAANVSVHDTEEAHAFGNLPEVRTLRMELRATIAQRLPPLVTGALHGAFGHALRERACRCPALPHARSCLYAQLAEPIPDALAPASVTTHAPSPVLFAPEDTYTGHTVSLAEDERLSLRVTLIGPARQHEALVTRTLEDAAARGLGIRESQGRGIRPSLSLLGVSLAPAPLTLPARRLRVRFVSPARIVDEGKIHGAPDGRRFLVALHRRADMLSQLYGRGSLPPLGDLDVVTSEVDTSVSHVRRYSTRQGRRMVWPGMTGSFVLEGECVRALSRLLAFGTAVQIGKGTTFGFGRFALEVLL